MATLDWNKLILTTTFSIYYFFFSWRNPLSPSVQPNQTYFSQKHKTQNPNWKFSNSHKHFYVFLSTNQIKLYTYPDLLKENPLLRKFLNSESTAYFLDETFYHTYTLLFSMTNSIIIFIKATQYSAYYTIHNSYDVSTKIQSSALKNVKLSYQVGIVDKNNVYFQMTCLLPKYWKLLPLSHTFIDHTVEHKKTINN